MPSAREEYDSNTDQTLPPPFVGRERELDQLRETYAAVQAGRGSLTLIAGEPGIGKTTLIEAFVARNPDRPLVLWGHCYDWEGTPAYWPWIQIVQVLRSSNRLDLDQLRRDRFSGQLGELVPELEMKDLTAMNRSELDPEQARFLLCEDIGLLLRSYSETTPLIIILEDLHWADRASIRVLDFLTRRMRQEALMFIGTYRDVEVDRDHPISPFLASARQQPNHRIELAGLSAPDVADFVATYGPAGYAADESELRRRTGGNPLFLSELIRMQFDEGRRQSAIPSTVADIILQRIQHFSDTTREILFLASVIGTQFEIAMINALDVAPPVEVLRSLSEATSVRLIEESGMGSYRFVHALVQETIYRDGDSARQAAAHQQIGDALERMYGSGSSGWQLAELARHFYRAAPLGDYRRAIDYSRQAGTYARNQYAWEEAIEHFQRVDALLDTWFDATSGERVDFLLEYADTLKFADREIEREAVADRAATIARSSGDAELLARTVLITDNTFSAVDFIDYGLIASLEEALDALEPGSSSLRLELIARLALKLHYVPGAYEGRRQIVDEALGVISDLDDPELQAHLLATCHRAMLNLDNLDERFRMAEQLIEIVRTRDVGAFRINYVFWMHFWNLLEAADYVAAIDALRLATQTARDHQSSLSAWMCQHGEIAVALLEGHFDSARRKSEENSRITSIPRQTVEQMSLRQTLEIERLSGEVAARTGELIVRQVEKNPDIPHWRIILALYHLEAGDRQRAGSLLSELLPFSESPNPDAYTLTDRAILAEIAVEVGSAASQETIFALLLPYQGRFAVPGPNGIAYGPISYHLGALATALGRHEDAEHQLTQAIEQCRPHGLRTYLARALAVRGRLPGRDRKADLDEARRIAQEIGLKPLLEKLELAGDPVAETEAEDNPYGLSPRELDVLRLLVDGRTDREIAEALFISPRTAMSHVANIRNKLGVDSRTAAAGIAIREGLV